MSQTENAPINWLPAFILIATPIAALTLIPWYALNHDFSTAAWVLMIGYLYANGLGITAGYHRLWAHRAYEAHWTVEVALMLFGGAAIQNSILTWASGHRTHHRFVDDVDKDPYSAKRGFWFSHMGWMLRNYPSSNPDYANVPDLQKNKIVMFQHNHYLAIVLIMNIAVPVIFGYLVGDVWGTVLLMGLLRLVISHHVTFFINSLAHMWGKQPYTDENTARDNFWLALLTYGEGYHNFHHIFQYDYRNGVKWWQFDPTKWLILSLSWLGLTKNLKRIPSFTIRKAELLMQFKRAQQQLEQKSSKLPNVDVEAMKQRFAKEYEAFVATMNDWGKLREEWYAEKKQTMMQKWEDAAFKTRFNEIDYRLKMQSKRVQLMMQQVMMPQVTAL